MHGKTCSLLRAGALLTLITLSPLFAQQENTILRSQLVLGNDDETAELCIDGSIAYVARGAFGVDIVDISNPLAPQKLLSLNPDPGGTVEIHDVQVHGGHLYAIDQSGVVDSNLGNFVGAYIYDVSTPAVPVLVNTLLWGDLNTPWSWRGAMSHNATLADIGSQTFLFVSSLITSGVEIFDVTDPQNIAWRAVVNPPILGAGAHDVSVRGTTLYTTWLQHGFTLHDLSALPTLSGIGDPYGPQSVPQLGWHSYSGAYTHGISPTANGSHVCTTDRYNGGRLRIFDVQSPSSITQVAEVVGSASTFPNNVDVEGDRACVSWFEDGLRIIDIADPAQPRMLGWYDTTPAAPSGNRAEGGFGVVANGSIGAYLTDCTGGLFVIDIQDEVTITSATYKKRNGEITIVAKSTASPGAVLTAVGHGVLTYQPGSNEYRGVFAVPSKPGSVTVTSSLGGEDTASFGGGRNR
ncbi:MAG: hypothetical protein RL885_01450 [Planctomycetota bacterium]